MWPSWAKSPSRVHTKSNPSPIFRHSSFKDLQSLCEGDEDQQSETKSKHHHQSKKASIFHRVRISTSVLRAWTQHRPPSHTDPPQPDASEPSIKLPGGEKRVVVYFTSLHAIRKTFDDCRAVRYIFRGFRVPIDERDVSMDAGFLDELQRIVGHTKLTLPRVFIGGRYIGGAEEIRQLNETGELKKLITGLPLAESGVCDGCGGHRFVMCEQCNGSRKVYTEKSGFRTCSFCNENGLIRCPSCASLLL